MTMSDSSTNAMKPKEPPCFESKTCGNCGHRLSSPRISDTACAVKVIQGDSQAGYAEIDMDNFGNCEACDSWTHRHDPAEQRYKQLEHVAKGMLDFIERVEQTAYEEFSEQLRDCGVSLDD